MLVLRQTAVAANLGAGTRLRPVGAKPAELGVVCLAGRSCIQREWCTKEPCQVASWFGTSMLLTELEVTSDDEDLVAGDLRDFYALLFRPRQMQGIAMWGYRDGKHSRKSAPLFHKGWSPEPAHAVYKQVTQEQWVIREQGKTGSAGAFGLRGFYGHYEVTLSHGDQRQKATAHLARGGAKAFVQLPRGLAVPKRRQPERSVTNGNWP